MCVDVDIEWLYCRMLGDRCRLESRETKGVMLFLFLGWCFPCEMAIYSHVLCGWDDEATKAVGAHNREQKHPNRYTRPGIADSRCVPCCLGLFRREWEKKTLQPRALTCSYLPSMRRWRAGVAGWICCATCGAVNFRFSVRHHTSGNHGDDWPRAPVRGRARTRSHSPEVTAPGPLQPFPIHTHT